MQSQQKSIYSYKLMHKPHPYREHCPIYQKVKNVQQPSTVIKKEKKKL